jgi:acyl carrier protein
MTVEQRVAELLAGILQLDAAEIGPASTIETIDTWDSLAVLSITLAVEEEFSIEIGPDEQLAVGSFDGIVSLVKAKTGL